MAVDGKESKRTNRAVCLSSPALQPRTESTSLSQAGVSLDPQHRCRRPGRGHDVLRPWSPWSWGIVSGAWRTFQKFLTEVEQGGREATFPHILGGDSTSWRCAVNEPEGTGTPELPCGQRGQHSSLAAPSSLAGSTQRVWRWRRIFYFLKIWRRLYELPPPPTHTQLRGVGGGARAGPSRQVGAQ